MNGQLMIKIIIKENQQDWQMSLNNRMDLWEYKNSLLYVSRVMTLSVIIRALI